MALNIDLFNLPLNYVWTIGLMKLLSAIIMLSLAIVTLRKYKEKKQKLSLYLSEMFFIYFISTFITTINTIMWYENRDFFDISPLPSITGSLLAIATNFMFRFVHEVFYTPEEQDKNKKWIAVHLSLILIMITINFIIGIFITKTLKRSPFGPAVIIYNLFTYIFLAIHVIKTKRKMLLNQIDEKYIQKMNNFITASIIIILSVACIIIDHLFHGDLSGYTYFSPLGYGLMAMSMYFFYKSTSTK